MSQSATPPNATSPALGSVAQRLVSLDAFRGTTMALMVLVNNSGDWDHTYGPLRHSSWNGWTITDVVFPSFLWIVGVAITLSLGGRLARGVAKSRLMLQVLRRAAILYALGVVGYLLPNFDFGTMRLLGVLQRIAICYLIASAIYLYAPRIRTQILWIVSLLIGYWLIMTLIPVPGFGAGRLDVEGNLAHYVDRIVLGHHNYAYTKTWDPEGIVGTLPSIATALFGMLAGHLLRLSHDLDWKTTRLFFAGNALIALGLICDIWMPINKSLWTSSFSLFMAGLDSVLLAGFIYLIDDLGYKRLVRPFVIFGMNAITIYMLSELLAIALGAIHWHAAAGTISLGSWLFDHCFAPLASPYNASLLWALAFVALMYLAAYAMYRLKWFIRV